MRSEFEFLRITGRVELVADALPQAIPQYRVSILHGPPSEARTARAPFADAKRTRARACGRAGLRFLALAGAGLLGGGVRADLGDQAGGRRVQIVEETLRFGLRGTDRDRRRKRRRKVSGVGGTEVANAFDHVEAGAFSCVHDT